MLNIINVTAGIIVNSKDFIEFFFTKAQMSRNELKMHFHENSSSLFFDNQTILYGKKSKYDSKIQLRTNR